MIGNGNVLESFGKFWKVHLSLVKQGKNELSKTFQNFSIPDHFYYQGILRHMSLRSRVKLYVLSLIRGKREPLLHFFKLETIGGDNSTSELVTRLEPYVAINYRHSIIFQVKMLKF